MLVEYNIYTKNGDVTNALVDLDFTVNEDNWQFKTVENLSKLDDYLFVYDIEEEKLHVIPKREIEYIEITEYHVPDQLEYKSFPDGLEPLQEQLENHKLLETDLDEISDNILDNN